MTTDQLVLALPPDPRQGATRKRDPQTSVDAARTCDAQRQKAQIMRLLDASLWGLTCDELGEQMHPQVHRSVAASRCAQLRRDGLAEPFGTRQNAISKRVQVWFSVPVSRRPVVTVPVGTRL